MINLGFTTAGLFFFAGFLYNRLGNTLLDNCGGIASKMPLLATFFLINRDGLDRIARNQWIYRRISDPARRLSSALGLWSCGLSSGVIFAAVYFLWYYERAMFGPIGEKVPQVLKDLTRRESMIAVSLCVMIFWIGLYPSPFLRMVNGSVQAVVDRLDRGSLASVERNRTLLSHAVTNEPGGKD